MAAGHPPPTSTAPDLPRDIRIGYARCSALGQELDSQLDALSKHGMPRNKIFSEKISTRLRVHPQGFGIVAGRPVRDDLPVQRSSRDETGTGSHDHGVLYAP
ncbi:hypothetical protein [Streptomyces sp. NBC_01314]|uniref:hypothetical protein n=1 Tax=Streptomyces sp. NBC_01314 TaxID=2903821 RepID=UPI003088876D|nr:hypothetical protein OG622_45040 [Streptomyces sp. NBC_01314]